MELKRFKLLLESLIPLANDIKEDYSAVEIYSGDHKHKLARTKYWNGVKALIDNGERNLTKRLKNNCKNLDRHKYAGLLLVVLLKKPLFAVNYGMKNRSIGYYSSSIVFAWKAALSLLKDYVFALSILRIPVNFCQLHLKSLIHLRSLMARLWQVTKIGAGH